MIQSLAAPEFNLRYTLESGQTFRWRRTNDGYLGIIGGSVVAVRQTGDQLFYDTSHPEVLDEAWLRRYFALDVDLPAILDDIDRDAQIHEAIQRYRGLRIMRQEPWECLASYILSSFNNIKRIEGMIERLAQRFGAPVSLQGYAAHTFPTAQAIAEAPLDVLAALGLGFRAAYLRDAARQVLEQRSDLSSLKHLPYDEAKATLLTVPGVGDKVADCVLLFGHDQLEAFPIDVWIERVLRFHFRRALPPRSRQHAFARRHFGRCAGYAQQYLFHHYRNKQHHHALSVVQWSRPSVPVPPRPEVAAALQNIAS